MRFMSSDAIRRAALPVFLSLGLSLPLVGVSTAAVQRNETPRNFVAESGVSSERASGGLIWSESDGSFTLEDLVRRCAPVLWFSHDEPLFKRGVRAPQSMFGD